MSELKTVDVFIGTSIRGPAKGVGRTMYILRTKLRSGTEYEGAPEVAEYDDGTESRLVLYAIRDALMRLNYACRVVVHTECTYVAAAITQHWPEKWQGNNWQSGRNKEVKDSVLWSLILQELEEGGHELVAEAGKHEYSSWMQWKMALVRAYKDVFSKVEKE